MEKNKIPWVVGLLVFGLSALAISFWIDYRAQRERDALIRIGQVERQVGDVYVFKPGANRKRKVGQIEFVSPFDTVETGESSEARIALDNTASVRILPESMVTLERVEMIDGVQDVLLLQRGEIEVESPGRDGEFFIAKNGQRVKASDYHRLPLSKEPIDQPVSVETDVTDAKSGLSGDEITATLTAQRPNFMKCYARLLQTDSKAKGTMTMSFTIENSGKVGLIELNSAELKNEEFKKCLSSVLGRVQFRAFQGTAISTFFPLKFE